MKMYSPDKSLLIDVRAVKEHPDGLVVDGRVMGTMPMKAILKPEELQAVLAFLNWRIILRVLKMLLKGERAQRTSSDDR